MNEAMCVYVQQASKNAPFPVPFRFTGNERAEKMACRSARSVLFVPPVLPFNPSACTRSNESFLGGGSAYRRVCTRGRQCLASSLINYTCVNGWNGTEQNRTAKKRGKTWT